MVRHVPSPVTFNKYHIHVALVNGAMVAPPSGPGFQKPPLRGQQFHYGDPLSDTDSITWEAVFSAGGHFNPTVVDEPRVPLSVQPCSSFTTLSNLSGKGYPDGSLGATRTVPRTYVSFLQTRENWTALVCWPPTYSLS